MEITRDIAVKVLGTVDVGLVAGVGKPIPGQMCVEAAVCYAMGLPHGDDPTCVSSALRQFKIRLNDANWSSKEARAKGLRRLALVQLGSRGEMDDKEFARRVAELAIRSAVPTALRAAAKALKPEAAAPLLSAADRCEKEGTSADAAAIAAATAADAAANAAYAAAYAAATAADAAADAAKAEDKILSDFAEATVQILIGMNVPGVQWLDLTEAAS